MQLMFFTFVQNETCVLLLLCKMRPEMEKNNRRTFLRYVIVGIVSSFVLVWNKLTINHVNLMEKQNKVFPFNKNKLVAFYRKYIVVNQKETTVFSARCTHLGCTINKFENNRLVCPCHGSEFDAEGNVVKGPAFKNLDKIPAQITDGGKQIKIPG